MPRFEPPKLSPLALTLLDRLECEELKLLTWGNVDGSFTEEELIAHADAVLEMHDAGSLDVFRDLIDPLTELGWLWQLPRAGRFRTRMAEAVRLFSRLRQIRDWGGDVRDDAWIQAPNLVADYRLSVAPRRSPRRDQHMDPDGLGLSPIAKDVLRSLLETESGGPSFPLAGFQIRSTRRILAAIRGDNRRTGGTIVCAGTGSGKTLSFYLPAITAVTDRMDGGHWVKCIAIYPRNELLKDQLREALANTRKVTQTLAKSGRRSVVLGALSGQVPKTANDVIQGKRAWARRRVGSRPARVCPFIVCPACSGEMAWVDADREQAIERLLCVDRTCAIVLTDENVRLTRAAMFERPPDILFTSTEMLNQRMGSASYQRLFGLRQPEATRPFLILLDEVHTYEGTSGAHTAYLLRRWKHHSRARAHFVGLSATLEDGERFFADLVGLNPSSVELVEPLDDEMEARGAEYQLALRGDPSSGAGLLSTSIQAIMLARRILGTESYDAIAGRRVFAFADNLDVINRLYFSLLDAEGRSPRGDPTGRPPLARHRANSRPRAADRDREGQNWELAERIGHVLSDGLVVRRTSSQDVGFDTDADVVVATSSLEVGFDDPWVGAIVQHKAPRAEAGFLQRKGRAGRQRSMRPWTVVVLSDFGRDRSAYQNYERLFSPVLRPRYLPLSNRTMLRMQATYALFEWLGRQEMGAEPWFDLSRPAWGPDADRQKRYVTKLRALLQDEVCRQEFEEYLQWGLGISPDEVRALLWEPPRAVLLEAVPTLLRRLETGWQMAFSEKKEPFSNYGPPIPEFVQKTLFGELLTPEVQLSFLDEGRNEPQLPIVQALTEFAPGRVSRRYAIDRIESDWICPTGPQLQIDDFCPAESRVPLGEAEYVDNGVRHRVAVYRPFGLRLDHVPAEVDPSSNARPVWRLQLTEGPGQPHEMPLPDNSNWKDVLTHFRFHTHHLGCPLEVCRFVTGSRYSMIRNGRRDPEASTQFVLDTEGGPEPSALGFTADVDAIEIRYRPPNSLNHICESNAELVRGLRPARFRSLVLEHPRLDPILNRFQRAQLADSVLCALTCAANADNVGLREAAEIVLHDPKHIDEAIAVMALWSENDGQDAGEDEVQLPRRVRELQEAIREDDVKFVLRETVSCLTEPLDDSWEEWLQARFRATLASAIRDAVFALCPRTDPESLLVELELGAQSDRFWLVETVLGGAGGVEAFYEAYARDPRRFFRLLEDRIGPSELEFLATRLEQVVAETVQEPQGEVGRAMHEMRVALDHQESVRALSSLRRGLLNRAIVADQTLLVSLHARVLRPGSSEASDEFLFDILERWNSLERRLNIDVDVISIAAAFSGNEELESSLGLAPSAEGPQDMRAWRYSVLRAVLWARGVRLREQALRVGNRFCDSPECDRLILDAAFQGRIEEIDRADPEWFARLTTALESDGAADLAAPAHDPAALAQALLHLATSPIETDGLRLRARLVGIRRTPINWIARLELPEAFQ